MCAIWFGRHISKVEIMVSLRAIRKLILHSLNSAEPRRILLDSPTPGALTYVSANRPSVSPAGTWFRTREGRHYACEIVLVIVVKLVLLVALWFVVIEPWPRPATSAANFVQQLYLPASPAVATKRHD